MKKIFCVLVCIFATTSLFAQMAVTPVDSSFFDVIYNFIAGSIPAKTLSIIIFVAWITEYVVTYVKWTPANSTFALIWNILKKIVAFLAGKKK